MKSQEVNFQKSQKLLASRAGSQDWVQSHFSIVIMITSASDFQLQFLFLASNNTQSTYTERQKKLITSSKRHTLKSKAFK